jgi:hypothetical protein
MTRSSILLIAVLCACTALLAIGCGDDDDNDSSDDDSTDAPECEGDGPDNGCPPGFYCDVDNTCAQDCTTDEQCVDIHGMFWICNDYGQCEYVGQ